jgi:hypothetical protein
MVGVPHEVRVLIPCSCSVFCSAGSIEAPAEPAVESAGDGRMMGDGRRKRAADYFADDSAGSPCRPLKKRRVESDTAEPDPEPPLSSAAAIGRYVAMSGTLGP